jgi:uncharacterized protein (DUF983 family)
MTPRPLFPALLRGLMCRCPRCGVGPLFTGFIKVRDRCPNCGEPMLHHRADDMPPYVVTFIVGHVIVGLMLTVEVEYAPPMWLHAALWLPLTILMCVALLRPVKGAIVAYQWSYRMHGFGEGTEPT